MTKESVSEDKAVKQWFCGWISEWLQQFSGNRIFAQNGNKVWIIKLPYRPAGQEVNSAVWEQEDVVKCFYAGDNFAKAVHASNGSDGFGKTVRYIVEK